MGHLHAHARHPIDARTLALAVARPVAVGGGRGLGATPAQTTSWIWALGLGMGLTSLGLSLHYRQPVRTAWSTPGAALLASSVGVALPEATGAFVVCAVLILLAGVTRGFERLMDRIPRAVAAALLGGVLTRFGLDAVAGLCTAPWLVGAMTATHLLARRWLPRYAVLAVLARAVATSAASSQLQWAQFDWRWARAMSRGQLEPVAV
jgi:benzoate membrane transport protein